MANSTIGMIASASILATAAILVIMQLHKDVRLSTTETEIKTVMGRLQADFK